MLSLIRSVLKNDCLLDINKTVLVGVSGGVDSLCLLDILWHLNIPVIVAHYNHKLQPKSDLAAEKVAEIASKLKLKFVQGVGEVNIFAEESGLTLEEAARVMRYQFLFGEAERYDVQAVVVGHNADDQVETFLMHVLRGSGLKGLTGMKYRSIPSAWSENIPLVRPLLGVWRNEILKYLAEHNLEPIMDPSNKDVSFFRNRLRHELIPYLEEYNPKVRRVLWNTANIMQEDYAVLEGFMRDAWQECLLEQGEDYLGINHSVLKNKPIGVQRHVLRQAIGLVVPDIRDIDYEMTNRAISFLETTTKSGKCELNEMVQLLQEDNCLWVYSKYARLPESDWPQFIGNTALEVNVPGKLNLSENWVIEIAYIRYDDVIQDQIFSNHNPLCVFIDADKVKYPLVVRNRRPGDRITPLGMGGRSMKLAHFMVNAKVPKRARENWPLICDSDEILWVPGYRVSHYSRVSRDTKEIMCLNIKKRNRD